MIGQNQERAMACDRFIAILWSAASNQQHNRIRPATTRYSQSARDFYIVLFISIADFLLVIRVGLLWILRSIRVWHLGDSFENRSEERRVGKECRCRWSSYH